MDAPSQVSCLYARTHATQPHIIYLHSSINCHRTSSSPRCAGRTIILAKNIFFFFLTFCLLLRLSARIIMRRRRRLRSHHNISTHTTRIPGKHLCAYSYKKFYSTTYTIDAIKAMCMMPLAIDCNNTKKKTWILFVAIFPAAYKNGHWRKRFSLFTYMARYAI